MSLRDRQFLESKDTFKLDLILSKSCHHPVPQLSSGEGAPSLPSGQLRWDMGTRLSGDGDSRVAQGVFEALGQE